MAYRPSDTAQKIIALLENAKVLAVGHQKRTMASDVVRACKIFSKGREFPISSDYFDFLAAAILDKMNESLVEAFSSVEEQVIQADLDLQSEKVKKPILRPF